MTRTYTTDEWHDRLAELNGWSEEESARRKAMRDRSHAFMERIFGPDRREKEAERNRKPSRCIHCGSTTALFLIYAHFDGGRPPLWQCWDCSGTLFASEADKA